ncbi:hypothetical protein [Geomonas agri]|uniref:hypothetical protein n=1 Tax=Geomonas agri TaxID=2873702 RepID=UPI001CD2E304|nr:hypothetical protein [Geomonas agri]
MGQQEQENNAVTSPEEGTDKETCVPPLHDASPDEKATAELAAKLMDGRCFEFSLTRGYSAEAIVNAVSSNWEHWGSDSRMRASGLLINAYKQKIGTPKGTVITELREGIAARIKGLDPSNALRILVSIGTHGPKQLKQGEISPQLCKSIQSHMLQGEGARYEGLFVKQRAEETRVFAQHLVAATGPYGGTRDPALPAKQLELARSFLKHDIFPLLDKQSIYMIADCVKTWTISMLPDLVEICGLFSSLYPDAENPFKAASQLARVERSEPPPCKETTVCPQPGPNDIMTMLGECFNNLESELASKTTEIDSLRKRIIQLNSDRLQLDEGKENKKKVIDELREKVSDLREEKHALTSTIRSKDDAIAALQKDIESLGQEIKSYEAKLSALSDARDQDVESLVSKIDSVSEHKVSELKRSIEMDLRPQFVELSHLPKDEIFDFHVHVLNAIFRKLRDKGIEIQEARQ